MAVPRLCALDDLVRDEIRMRLRRNLLYMLAPKRGVLGGPTLICTASGEVLVLESGAQDISEGKTFSGLTPIDRSSAICWS